MSPPDYPRPAGDIWEAGPGDLNYFGLGLTRNDHDWMFVAAYVVNSSLASVAPPEEKDCDWRMKMCQTELGEAFVPTGEYYCLLVDAENEDGGIGAKWVETVFA